MWKSMLATCNATKMLATLPSLQGRHFESSKEGGCTHELPRRYRVRSLDSVEVNGVHGGDSYGGSIIEYNALPTLHVIGRLDRDIGVVA